MISFQVPSRIRFHTLIFKQHIFFFQMVHCCSTTFDTLLNAPFQLQKETTLSVQSSVWANQKQCPAIAKTILTVAQTIFTVYGHQTSPQVVICNFSPLNNLSMNQTTENIMMATTVQHWMYMSFHYVVLPLNNVENPPLLFLFVPFHTGK